mmetsp:Transcript_105869/g.337167  ORF Transcript_105869/g.337167 Transcript_105869/m.337167 type:complete len:205 (-) Transcript_105869:62-676(-)
MAPAWAQCCCVRTRKGEPVAADAPVQPESEAEAPRTLSARPVDGGGGPGGGIVRTLSQWYRDESRPEIHGGGSPHGKSGEVHPLRRLQTRLVSLSWWYDGRADVLDASPVEESTASTRGCGSRDDVGSSDDDTVRVLPDDDSMTDWWLDGQPLPSAMTDETEELMKVHQTCKDELSARHKAFAPAEDRAAKAFTVEALPPRSDA